MSKGKREQIINATIEVLKHENFRGMRTAQVASVAGVAEGTLYRYFENKRNLFIETLRHITATLEEVFLQGLSSEKSWKENLNLLGSAFSEHRTIFGVYYRIMYKAFSEVDDSEIREELRKVFTNGIERIKNILKMDKNFVAAENEDDIEVFAMLIWGAADMLWKKHAVLSDRESGYERDLSKITDFLERLK